MPTDSNGVHSLPAGYLATTGQTIQASQHNPPLEDISTALTARMPRNGAAPMTAALKVYDGTVGSPGVQFSSAGTTGIYKTSSGLGVSVGGVLVGEFTSSGLSATLAGATPTVSGILTLTSTSHLAPATGTTAQRPASPAASNLRYNSTLNALEYHDGTSWRQVSAAQPIAAGFKNLTVYNNGANPDTRIDITADAVTVETSTGDAYRLRNVSVTINAATTGADALDTGSLGASTWYALSVIYNPSTGAVAGLASTSETSPTLPSGYTAFARVGWNRTSASSLFHRVMQKGRKARYVVASGTQTTAFPAIALSSFGTFSSTSPVFLAHDLSALIPSTATSIQIVVNTNVGGGSGSNIVIAPSSLHRGIISSNPPLFSFSGQSQNVQGVWSISVDLVSTTLYAASSTTDGGIYAAGWEDNI